MIKPSHYGDDGYPIVWWKTMIPSNSLAALYGIARDCAERQVLGPDVRLELLPIDETNTHVVPAKIARDIRRRGVKALIGFVGVQSNQYDRALDLAREFRAEGLPVIIGGFHVSGCLSMLKEMPAELQAALDIGCSLFAGECEEGRLDGVLRDAWAGELKPIYNYLNDLPGLEGVPVPALAGRGAQAQCRQLVELRSRARLPVPVQLLHDHQRPGAQEPFPQRRRSRGDHPRECRARA